jgi:hypothetical protein
MKIIIGVAMVAGLAALAITTGGVGDAFFGVIMTAMHASVGVAEALAAGLAMAGAGLIVGGISDMLFHTPGSTIASRNAIAPWQIIYGRQRVGGTIVDIGETGSSDKFLHLVIVCAAHQCQSFDGLYLDGKQVFFSGSVLSGSNDDGGDHYDESNTKYNFGGRVYCQAFLGTATQSACADYVTRSSGHWTSAHRLQGRAYIYLRLTYDTTVFPNGMPGVKSNWHGKQDILDPRSGTRGYTENAALCVADYLTNADYGLRCSSTEINWGTSILQTAGCIWAAANICDTAITLAAGGTEPAYALNGVFMLSSTPGEIVNNMLSACAGQISYNGGMFSIYPAAWRGASVSIDKTNLLAPISYKPKRRKRELYNQVRGTFLSPLGPPITRGPGLPTGTVNPWDGEWTYTDIPDYCEDVSHGYTSDVYFAQDGETQYLDTKFPFTISVATCQRLAKIMLERNRQQGTGTLQCSLSCYAIQPLDIIQFTYSRFGWVNKQFEVSATRLTFKADTDGSPPVPVVELDIAETDPKVYAWGTAEDLPMSGQASPLLPNKQNIPGPTAISLLSGPTTCVTGADGIHRSRILVTWTAPNSAYVTSGGKIMLQWQLTGASTLLGTQTLHGTDVSAFIDNVFDGSSYTIQMFAISTSNVYSATTAAGPIVVSNSVSVFSSNNVTYPTGETVTSLKPAQAGADVTHLQAISYAGTSESLVPNGNFVLGNIQGYVTLHGTAVTYAGGGLFMAGDASQVEVATQSFAVIPGQKYRLTATGASSNASISSVYMRLQWATAYAPYMTDAGGSTQVLLGYEGVAWPATATTNAVDWTAPAGANWASLLFWNWRTGTSASFTLTNITCQPYAAAGQWGADVTASQPVVYAGASESIVPNGNFILGNILGWTTVYGTGGSWSGSYLLVTGNSATNGIASPSFQVVPGQKYRLNYLAFQSGGSPGQYLRISYSATRAASIVSGVSGVSDVDFVAAGTLATSQTNYSYDWTCPAGALYASMSVFTTQTASLGCISVACTPYSASGQWGADVTTSHALFSQSVGTTSGPSNPLTTYALIPEMSASIVVGAGGGNVLVLFSAAAHGANTGSQAFAEVYLDGVAQPLSEMVASADQAFNEHISISYILTGLSAGAHTISIYGHSAGLAGSTWVSTTRSIQLLAVS